MVLTNEILHVIYPVYLLSVKPFEISLLFLCLVIHCFKWFVFFSGAVNKRLRAYDMKLCPSCLRAGKNAVPWVKHSALLPTTGKHLAGGKIWLHNNIWMNYHSCGETELWQHTDAFSPVWMLWKRDVWSFVTAESVYMPHCSVHQKWLVKL